MRHHPASAPRGIPEQERPLSQLSRWRRKARRPGGQPRPGAEPLEPRLFLFSCGLFGEPAIHEAITADALPFLYGDVFNNIMDEHVYVDFWESGYPSSHFDSCYFYESSASINARYLDAAVAASPTAFAQGTVANKFGQLLHTVQDFYAHSNWVDMGMDYLVDASAGYWNPLTPFSLRGRAIIIQGEDPPAGWAVGRGANHDVWVWNGVSLYPGIVSGTFASLADDCPDEVDISHGELNKDKPDRAWFAQAADMAVRQTRHEFYRLIKLTEFYFGSAQHLINAWVPGGAANLEFRALMQQESPLAVAGWSLPEDGYGTGTVTVHIGPYASRRQGGYGDDLAESVIIRGEDINLNGILDPGEDLNSNSLLDDNFIRVEGFGQAMTFSGVTMIVADGGLFDDQITLMPGVKVATRVTGSAGNDVLCAGPGNLQVAGSEGDDTLTLDLGAAATPAAGLMIFDGGGGQDKLVLANPPALSNIGVDCMQACCGTSVVTTAGVEGVTLDAGDQPLGVLTVGPNGTLSVPAGQRVINVASLTLDPIAWVDLADNMLIVQDPLTYGMLRDRIASARNAPMPWHGPGLGSSAARNDPAGTHGLAILLGAEYAGTPFVPAQAVVVKYAVEGDSDLNGIIDGDDYFRMDRGIVSGSTMYSEGNVDYRGGVDGGDCWRIDAAFLKQSVPLLVPFVPAASLATSPPAAALPPAVWSIAPITADPDLDPVFGDSEPGLP